jgi:signal transduction histidine kinase
MNDSLKVLLIEDNPGDARLIRELLTEEKGGSFRLECTDRLSAAIERLASGKVDVILLDLGLPDSQGFDTFIKVHNSVPQIPIVILSGLTDEELAARAVRKGAQDYLVKGHVDSNLLGRSLRYAIERKQAEVELQKYRDHLEELVEQRTTELTAINKELESFSYSVSHDLRAPLRGIDGFSQALLEDYPDKLDEQGRNYLHRTRAAAQRMSQLIDDMLNLSRVTRYEMRRETVDLSTLARKVTAELQKTQPGRQVEFVITEGLTVNGDTALLRVALENLLGNAWKFTGKQPRARIEFGVTQHEGKPAYYVRDDGVGFDMTYVGKLFAPFQRLHSAEEFPGTGIGLATVQRIILRHGGTVWAEGAVGKGAAFYFTLKQA